MTAGPGRSSLTDAEVRISESECIDLGPAYPDEQPPRAVLEVWAQSCADGIKSPLTAQIRTRATESLSSAVLGFLGIRHEAIRIVPTCNGSTALQRAIMTAVHPRRPVLIASPVIDIVPGMIAESRCSRIYAVQPAERSLAVDYTVVAQEIASIRPGCCVIVSPLNPTGQVATAGELQLIAEACQQAGTRLVVDQCFAEVSPWQHHVPHVAQMSAQLDGLEWLEVWDTGKTFGCNDAKLGFIIGHGPLLTAAEHSVRLVQFDIPHLMKLFFSRLLSRPELATQMQNRLAQVARVNLHVLEQSAHRWATAVLAPDAGSVALVVTPMDSILSGPMAHLRLLEEARVGVIDGSCFLFARSGRPARHVKEGLLRFALARHPNYFAEGIARIENWLP